MMIVLMPDVGAKPANVSVSWSTNPSDPPIVPQLW